MQPVRAATVGVRHIASLSATGPACAANTDLRNVRSLFGKFKVFPLFMFQAHLKINFPSSVNPFMINKCTLLSPNQPANVRTC